MAAGRPFNVLRREGENEGNIGHGSGSIFATRWLLGTLTHQMAMRKTFIFYSGPK